MIPFNRPYLHGRELVYIAQSVASGKISGDGVFSRRCHDYFEKKYGFKKALLTTSCTDALEMAAILLDLRPGDEVILPSFTFVSTANAFVLRGATLVFADSCPDHPNIDPKHVADLVTKRTKAIVVVHYAGVACDMAQIMAIAAKNHISVIEDAAQAIDSYYKDKPLGSLGSLGAFSFHETKNIIAGEGGLLAINDAKYIERAEIIREKGTNRSAFFRGEMDKYSWVDIGSSFLPPDTVAAYLFAQLEQLNDIQARRLQVWKNYELLLRPLAAAGHIKLPILPPWATNNAHMFYLLCRNLETRSQLIESLKQTGIHAVFHYLPLHKSPFFTGKYAGRNLVHCDRFSDTLVRLPLFYEMTDEQVRYITSKVSEFFGI
ncbi:MAG: dTDP-4-amino-4,6-dideoxygalactose transaminase [Verrucomicrobiota bacterium]